MSAAIRGCPHFTLLVADLKNEGEGEFRYYDSLNSMSQGCYEAAKMIIDMCIEENCEDKPGKKGRHLSLPEGWPNESE